MRRHSRKRGNLRPFYIWHRRIGLLAGFFVLILSLTGLALNHTESLRLDERYVSVSWLLNWYGIGPPDVTTSFATGESWVALVEDQLYLDDRRVPGTYTEISGAALIGGTVIIVADGDALVLTTEGEFIERLSQVNGVPAGIEKIGAGEDQAVIVSAAHGLFRSKGELIAWVPALQDPKGVDWSSSAPAPQELTERLRRDYQSHILPLERVLLDLHSGRIVGGAGVILMDLAAIILILLIATGGWIWVKRFG
jgi:hypothetical protein